MLNRKSKEIQKKEYTPEEKIERKQKALRRIWNDIVFKIIFIVGFLVISFTFVFGVTIIETDDMYPAVRPGDVVIYFRPIKELANKDVILYEDNTSDEVRIGRVEGCEGTIVDKTKSGILTIDGNMQPVQERIGIYYSTKVSSEDKLEYPSSVPSGSYLVLGDKREDAVDSRLMGYIEKENIKGKVFTILRRRAL